MKQIGKYQEMGLTSENAVFEFLLSSWKDTIHAYDFFVAWDKVLNHAFQAEIALNILNCLIGKENIENHLKELIKRYPEVVSVIPLLIAVREKSIRILERGTEHTYSFLKKNVYTQSEIDDIVVFAQKSGLLQMLKERKIKNLVDYAIGVEVGLDTNARKNRTGKAMENLTEMYVKSICEKYKFEYLAQVTVKDIAKKFEKTVSVDKADRHFDFALDTGKMLYLMEVNYYGSGGSKLKAVAGEFTGLYHLVSKENIRFIWITDGVGWNTAKRPLREAFDQTDFILNIDMVEKGILDEIVTKGL